MASHLSKNGVLCLTAADKKNLEIMFQHVIIDTNLKEEGSYVRIDKNGERKFDEKQANKSLELVKILRAYVETCVD